MEVEDYINSFPFLKYINEDKSHYKHAKDCGFNDPDDLFLYDDSFCDEQHPIGGFLLNINAGYTFVDTYLFTEMADFYRKHKKYHFYTEDSVPERQLRKREEYRRKHGFSAPCLKCPDGHIESVRITGSHYNFLNYTLMEQLDEKSIKAGSNANVGTKKYDFSKFIDAQFWTFHVMEFAENNGFHLMIDKTRRGGFSYIMASDSANEMNLRPKKVLIHVAINSDYLTTTGGLTDFTINNLRFYETHTMFKRGILSMNKENYKLGFKLPNGQESPKSWGSALFSVSANNNPNCAIGKDARKVKTEEVSTMNNFDEFMDVTEPAMRTGAYVTGCLMCWGTATAGNMQTFAINFYDPRSRNFMPFVNVWDKDSRQELCGYFKAYCWGLQGEIDGKKAMDENGNSDIETGLRIAYREREIKKGTSKTFADYINYLGQYANMPCESFNSTTENMFSSEELMGWEEKLRTDDSYKFYIDGSIFINGTNVFNDKSNKLNAFVLSNTTTVEFKSNVRIRGEGGKYKKDYYDWITGVPRKGNEDPHGCIRQWFAPMKIEYTNKEGRIVKGVPPGLYSISYDPVGINKDKNEITNRHSHNSIKVWENPTSYNGFKSRLVCAYYGRPENLREADLVLMGLSILYNCIGEDNQGNVWVEINRGETVSNFKTWKATKYLAKDPIYLWDTTIKGHVSGNYGISIGDTSRKLEGLRYLKEMLYTVIGQREDGTDIYLFETIFDRQSIIELQQWNNMGNFDRVSEMLIRAVEWKAKNYLAAKELQHRKEVTEQRSERNILRRTWY